MFVLKGTARIMPVIVRQQPKSGLLILVFRVTRVINQICLHQRLDNILLPKRISQRNLKNSSRYYQKNLEDCEFYDHCLSNNGHVTGPQG